jgi:polyferredoxin
MRYHDEMVTKVGEGRLNTDAHQVVSVRASRTGRVIKKIPPVLRRRRMNFSTEAIWYRRFLWRLREDSQFQRSVVQSAFVLLCIWIGVEFHLFVTWGLSGGTDSFANRPPGVEGFLPISALISLNYWLQTGVINTVHPSGLFILLAVVGVSLVLKKAFCSWLCPIGTLSESLWMLGRKLIGRNVNLPRWLDYPLRSLKYLLLLFFSWSVWRMDILSLEAFVFSPYNKMADVKMYLFFAEIGGVALLILLGLVVLSLFIRNFWCRFLCPYGALLGLAGWLSPLKITRNVSTCIDCELCMKACPASIAVHKTKRVWSDECMSCMACVDACPVKQTLDVRLTRRSKPVPTWAMGVLVVGMFVAITGMAMLTGHWQNRISQSEYQRRFEHLNSPLYQHARGKVPNYGPSD